MVTLDEEVEKNQFKAAFESDSFNVNSFDFIEAIRRGMIQQQANDPTATPKAGILAPELIGHHASTTNPIINFKFSFEAFNFFLSKSLD